MLDIPKAAKSRREGGEVPSESWRSALEKSQLEPRREKGEKKTHKYLSRNAGEEAAKARQARDVRYSGKRKESTSRRN